MAIRELHHTHRLAVALRIGHAEVARRPLLDVAALLVPDQRHRPALQPAEPGHESGVVRPSAIAVELEEVLEDPLDVVERVRTVLVARQLDGAPDLGIGGLGLDPVELSLQPLELAREACAAKEIEAA